MAFSEILRLSSLVNVYVSGEDIRFVATGVTDGELLHARRESREGARIYRMLPFACIS